MAAIIATGSAKILQFPRGGRAGLAVEKSRALASVTTSQAPLPPILPDGAWYHAEAVQTDGPTQN